MLNYKEIFAKPLLIVVIFFILSFSILSLVLSYYLEVETAVLLELSCFVSLLLAGLLYLLIWYSQKQTFDNSNRFRFLAGNSSNVIWILDANTMQYKYVSDACFVNTGYTSDDYYCKTLTDMLTPESAGQVKKVLEDKMTLLKTGKAKSVDVTFEAQQNTRWGEKNWVQVTATLSINHFGRVSIIGITRIINDEKKAVAQIQANEKMFLEINSNVNDVVWILDWKTKKYLYVSQSSIAITGYIASEIVGSEMQIDFFMSKEESNLVFNKIKIAIEKYKKGETSNASITFDTRILRKDKKIVYVEINATIIVNESFEPIKLIGITRDVSKHKQLELALRESETLLQAITNNSNDHIWILNAKTMQYVYNNSSIYNMIGYTVEEMYNVKLSHLFSQDSMKLIDNFIGEKVRQFIAGEIDRCYGVFELQIRHKNGNWVWIEISATGVLDANNNLTEIYGISRVIEEKKQLELKLKDIEKKWQAVTSNSNDLIWILDYKTMKYTYMSPSSMVVNGCSAEEAMLTRTMLDSFLPKDINRISSLIADNIEQYKRGEVSKIQAIFEAQLVRKDRSLVWIEISATATVNSRFELVELIGISRIIEDRKQLELALKESEDKYRYITEKSMDCIWTLNTHLMKFTYVSEAVHKLFGFTPQEMQEMELSDMMPPDSVDNLMQLLFGLVNNAKEANQRTIETIYELQQYTKSGHAVWVEVSASGTLSSKGELDELIGVSRVIEDKKWLELTLKESEEKYRMITENQRDIIWTMDLQTLRYTFMSGACYELTGFTVEEYLNMTAQEALPPESFALIVNLLESQLQKFHSGEVKYPAATFELQQYHKNGSLTWVEISAKMLIDQSAGSLQIIATTRGIDERKTAEMQILKQNEELETLNATKNKFFSIIAHDLKNPLAALINVANIFNDYLPKMKQNDIEKNVFILTSSAQHVYDLFENLLEWARSSSGNMTFISASNNIIEVINQCFEDLKIQALAKNINIDIPAETNECYVDCDINMIHTVIRNLISNAIKFSFENSTIEVDVIDYPLDNNFVQISIADHGVGIAQDTVDKLFRIDKKVNSTKGTAEEKGTGLGLILCQEFIAKHNCKIWVESEIDKGTTFFFTLQKSGEECESDN